MGLDILTERLQKIRQNQPAANKVGWLLNVANVVCLDEFLYLLAKNLTALAQFKALLNGLIITASETVSVLNLVIAQLETANQIANTFLQTFKSAANAAKNSLHLFPFDDPSYLHCPPIQAVKDYITKLLPMPDPASLLPGNAKKYAKKYKQAVQSFKELEYRIYRNERKIIKMKKKIEEVKVSILAWQAIVDAIGEQFGI